MKRKKKKWLRIILNKMEEQLKKTRLDGVHTALGAKMVSFAGYSMPLQYSSQVKEHLAVRASVGIFDVSHMGEFFLKGPKALDLIQKVCSNDAAKLAVGDAQYSCLPNDEGGIVDDLLVYRIDEEEYMLVVNASNIEKDWNWIEQYNTEEHNTERVQMENHSEAMSLFAVQGPLAGQVLQRLTEIDLSEISYYKFVVGNMAEIDRVIISATGYTGAGGFELYVPNEQAIQLWEAIMLAGKPEEIQAVGLAARDSLRLEMGYCLYGNDIDDTTSPIEAGLSWITKFSKSFVNSEALLKQKKEGVQRKLVGFKIIERGIPRSHYLICNAEQEVIGEVTSGCHSPSLKEGIGMGYVPKEYAKAGTELLIQVRKKYLKAEVIKLPFVVS